MAANLVLGTLLWWNKYSILFLTRFFSLECGFSIGYSIGRKYRSIWVSVSELDLNQNNGFSRIPTQGIYWLLVVHRLLGKELGFMILFLLFSCTHSFALKFWSETLSFEWKSMMSLFCVTNHESQFLPQHPVNTINWMVEYQNT